MDAAFEKPKQVSQAPTLFQQTLKELCASVGAGPDELGAWRARGWLSFDPAPPTRFEDWHFVEATFIKGFVRTGLIERFISGLLHDLRKPYCYRAETMAFCFGRNCWVQHTEPPDARTVIEETLDDYMQSLFEAGDVDRLSEIGAIIAGLLEREDE